jgi:xylulose-5-phosphate/fructose-6-phosphate phosphoketolase
MAGASGASCRSAKEARAHLKILEDWMRSYRPEELFDEQGKLVAELSELAPKGDRRMSANPHANGGLLLRDLVMPDFRKYAVKVKSPGTEFAESTRVLGGFLRDVMKLNLTAKNFRVFGPDETCVEPVGSSLRGNGQAVDGADPAGG